MAAEHCSMIPCIWKLSRGRKHLLINAAIGKGLVSWNMIIDKLMNGVGKISRGFFPLSHNTRAPKSSCATDWQEDQGWKKEILLHTAHNEVTKFIATGCGGSHRLQNITEDKSFCCGYSWGLYEASRIRYSLPLKSSSGWENNSWRSPCRSCSTFGLLGCCPLWETGYWIRWAHGPFL